ncbi:MAG TPA: flagellar basal body rod protein FlgC [Phycisphaerales bacterium]|nr:flagellar basal body rod protein FlgC [Phycisphaerales bacterium]
MYGGLDVSVSGMIAQRTRMDTIAANLANQGAILDSSGKPNPYQRRIAVFMPGDPDAISADGKKLGVHVGQIQLDDAPPKKVWDPGHPYARQVPETDAGYVYYPNVDPVTEQINAVDAMRAYEANVAAAEATKSMIAQALRLLA